MSHPPRVGAKAGAEDDAETVDAHGLRLFLRRKGLPQDGLRQRYEGPAADALKDTKRRPSRAGPRRARKASKST